MRKHTQRPKKSHLLLALVAGLLIALLGCGRQEFNAANSKKFQKAPGSFSIPPKVDILLAEDDTGSMSELFPAIQTQFPQFLQDLENKGWDYHFAVTPLTSLRSFSQIAASHFDPSWGSDWTPPYPGAPAQADINISRLRSAQSFTQFLSSSLFSNSQGGNEKGLQNILDSLTQLTPGTGFVRRDALLVIVIVGNGKDTSRVNLCNRTTGQPIQSALEAATAEYVDYCEITGAVSFQNYNSSLASIQTEFINFKKLNSINSTAPIRAFAAVASQFTRSCRGQTNSIAFDGARYRDFAGAFSNKTISFDICRDSISLFIDALASDLEVQRLKKIQKYIPLDQEPNESSIIVTKFVNGNENQAITLANSSVNGWTFAGLVNDFAIESPYPLDFISAFAIELHGSAKLVGDDTATVTFTPKGVKNSDR